MSVLVVGSVALDTVETPFGRAEEALGGSAVYFSTAASLFTQVNLVGVVGNDFPPQHGEFLRQRGIDVRGLQVQQGSTFRWVGRYDYDLNVAHTVDTRLNVFADFHPVLPAGYEASEFVLLANIHPALQIEVLRQVHRPRLTVLDTMNYWIESQREALTAAMRQVDVVLMNEGEVREFAQTYSLIRAARTVLQLGPRAVIVKKGEYGAVLFSNDHYFVAPAYPLEDVKDPTGAGDSFAGGFIGYLAQTGDVSPENIRRAIVHGSVVASFCVEDFSVARLASATKDEVAERFREFRQFTLFD
ncbi:MAG: sugar kinase [Chloroflexi bacterium]|nr:sugar kinase [Chloroflexota bacterium]